MSKKNRKNQAVEDAQPMVEEAPAMEQQEELLEFDAWWASRGPMIPAHHHKEILKADFAAQGLKAKASMEDYDKALKRYGVKI
jgi:hypothetical protein